MFIKILAHSELPKLLTKLFSKLPSDKTATANFGFKRSRAFCQAGGFRRADENILMGTVCAENQRGGQTAFFVNDDSGIWYITSSSGNRSAIKSGNLTLESSWTDTLYPYQNLYVITERK